METSLVSQVVAGLIGSGPVALVLFYWVYSERKERIKLQDKIIAILEKTAGLAEAQNRAMDKLRVTVNRLLMSNRRGSIPDDEDGGI